MTNVYRSGVSYVFFRIRSYFWHRMHCYFQLSLDCCTQSSARLDVSSALSTCGAERAQMTLHLNLAPSSDCFRFVSKRTSRSFISVARLSLSTSISYYYSIYPSKHHSLPLRQSSPLGMKHADSQPITSQAMWRWIHQTFKIT